jgi:hypothetical protein
MKSVRLKDIAVVALLATYAIPAGLVAPKLTRTTRTARIAMKTQLSSEARPAKGPRPFLQRMFLSGIASG